MNQFLVVAAAEKIAAMQTEESFLERQKRADKQAFRRILNRKGARPPGLEDEWNAEKVGGSAKVKTSGLKRSVQRASTSSSRVGSWDRRPVTVNKIPWSSASHHPAAELFR